MAKLAFKKIFLTSQLYLICIKKNNVKCYIWNIALMLKFEHFGKYIRNTWKAFECGAGEGWRRSIGAIVFRVKQYYVESRKRTINGSKANRFYHILRRNCLLKHVIEVKVEGRTSERRTRKKT
jgi:hypothetical protein